MDKCCGRGAAGSSSNRPSSPHYRHLITNLTLTTTFGVPCTRQQGIISGFSCGPSSILSPYLFSHSCSRCWNFYWPSKTDSSVELFVDTAVGGLQIALNRLPKALVTLRSATAASSTLTLRSRKSKKFNKLQPCCSTHNWTVARPF